MKLALLFSLGLAVAVGFMLSLPGHGRAACCDESSMECRTGQKVGDKGSCSVSGEVCVQLAEECPGKDKHPGVLCDCGKPNSSVSLNPQFGLTFDKTFRKDHFTVSNAGNVPLHIQLSELGDTSAFAVKAPRKCKKKNPDTDRVDEADEYALQSVEATIRPQGCLRFPVKFKAHRRDVYSDQLDIKTDALQAPTEVFYDLFGSIGRPRESNR
jgi:hypothetical protein